MGAAKNREIYQFKVTLIGYLYQLLGRIEAVLSKYTDEEV